MGYLFADEDYSMEKQAAAPLPGEKEALLIKLVKGGFFDEYLCAVGKATPGALPKRVIPADRENFEYLVGQCRHFAKTEHGRLQAAVDNAAYYAWIDVYLPFFEFEDDRSLLQDIAVRADSVTFTKAGGDKMKMHITFRYFEDVFEKESDRKAAEQNEKEKFDQMKAMLDFLTEA